MNIKPKKKVTLLFQNQLNRFSTKKDQNKNTSNSHSLSVSKRLRQPSVGMQAKKQNPQLFMSQEKIQFVKTQKGFLIDKKYLAFEIQCFISKNNQFSKSFSLIIDMNQIHICKNQIHHSFQIQKDGRQFLQVKIDGYKIQDIIIPNRRIQFIKIQIPYDNMTIVKPIEMLQQNQDIRRRKIIGKNNKIEQFLWTINVKKQKQVINLEKKLSSLSLTCYNFHKLQTQYQKPGRNTSNISNQNQQIMRISRNQNQQIRRITRNRNKQNSKINNNMDQIYNQYYVKKNMNKKQKNKLLQQQSFDRTFQNSNYNFRF